MASTTHQASAASHSLAVSRTGVRAVIEGGALAGLVGAATVAVWFLLLDFVRVLFVAFEAILLGLEVSVVPRLVGALGTWTVALANLLSAVVMF